MPARLGINIDHVATLREQRHTPYPSLIQAARASFKGGADQITIHLREDRRHIQDTDLSVIKLVTEEFGRPLNLELGLSKEMLPIAVATAPSWVCLVPEKRNELTTEGGLNLQDEQTYKKVGEACDFLKLNLDSAKISLFLEADEKTLERSQYLNIDAVEIHTGRYAQAQLDGEDLSPYLKQFENSKKIVEKQKRGHHAGHGLTRDSLIPLAQQNIFEEYNIGHWVVCEGLFYGIEQVVKDLKGICYESC